MLRPKILNKSLIFICDCGNSDQSKINNFLKYKLTTDERGYEKSVRVNARICTVCKVVVTIEDALRQLDELNKKNRQDGPSQVESS